MKTVNITGIFAAAAFAVLTLTGCSDFLDKKPITEPSNETYLSSEPQVASYINGLYTALPSFSQYGMSIRGEEKNSDNIIAEKYDKRLNGEYTAFSGSSDWSKGYNNLRDVNYFFEYYLVDEADETDELRSYRGEALFFRAYWHFYLLKRFGNIPVMDAFWDKNATLEGLQIPATPRNEVARFILKDLADAAALLHPRSTYKGLRVNKETALTLAMNVALFEGSWEKYHASDEFAATNPESEYFFGQVMSIGDELFKLMAPENSLNTAGNDPVECKNPGDAWAHLFNQKDYSKVDEALFWKKYSIANGVYHSVVPLLAGGVTDNEGAAGLSKSLADSYLNADGSFIDKDDVKYRDFNETFKGRDPRMTETIMSSGHKFRSATVTRPMLVKERIQGEDLTETEKEENAKILPPYIFGDGNARNLTGYHIAAGTDSTFLKETFWDTGLIVIRYAEALLAYAEAAEELGRCDNAVMEKTVGELRKRAGVKYTAPVADPDFTDFGYALTPNMQEIRRERRVELALQGFRLDDLLRWKGEKLIVGQRGKGAYFGEDGILYKSYNMSDPDIAEGMQLLKKDKDGFLDPLAGLLPDGYRFNPKRDYLLPIPPDDVQMNDKLDQNPNW